MCPKLGPTTLPKFHFLFAEPALLLDLPEPPGQLLFLPTQLTLYLLDRVTS